MRSAIRMERHGDVAKVIIDREDRLNAFDDELIRSFVDLLEKLDKEDRPPRAAVLTGAGETSFCAGYDINCIDPDQSLDDPFPDDRFERAVRAVESFGAPVVAALNGNAFGGGLDLALACDFRFAGPDVKLAMTPAKLGLVYSRSGISRFVRRIGPGLTGRLFLTAAPIDAREALELGLVDGVVEKEAVLPRAMQTANEIAKNSPLAVQWTRRTIQAVASNAPEESELWAEIATMRNLALRSEDLRKALAEFVYKKKKK